jgi:tetratricopeptide (TPR) repeat protein
MSETENRMKVRMVVRRLAVTAAALMMTVSCSTDPEVAKREHFARGERYFEQQKYNEAIIEYRSAVQNDARYGEARARLAAAYVEVNNLPAALREYVRAADLLPKDADVQLKAGEFLLMAGRYQDAKGRAEKLLALDARSVNGHILHGNAMAGLKDIKGAIAEIEEAIQIDPKESRAYMTLGMYELARDKRDPAKVAFEKAVEMAPQSVEARLALANFHIATRNMEAAEQTLRTAVGIAPDHAVANRMLAMFYMFSNRSREAEPFLKAIAENTTDPEPQLALADYYMSLDRLGEAVAILEKLATEKNMFAAAKIRLATMEYARGRKEVAHQIVDEVLAKEPKNPQLLLLKGRLLFAERKLDEALMRVKQATEAGPRLVQAHYVLGQIHAAKNDLAEATKAFNDVLKLNPRAAAAQVQISRLHLTRGGSEAAVQFAEEAVKNQPRSAQAHLALAKGLLAKGDLARAEAELKLLSTGQPDVAVVHAQIGLLRLKKGEHATARRSFDRALELDPAHVPAMAGIVGIDVANKQIAAARAKVEAWQEKLPNNVQLLLLAARTYAVDRDAARAEQALRKVIELDPSALEAYSGLGQIYVATNRLDQALKEFEEFAKRQPKSVGAHTLVATILHAQNRIPEARARYERVLTIDSRAPVAANNLAWLYAENGGNLDMAVDLALTARARLPESAAVTDTLGWVYFKKNRPEQAIPALRESTAKEPNNALYRFHLGLAYAKAGEKDKARAELEQALKINADFPGADEARRTLATVKG